MRLRSVHQGTPAARQGAARRDAARAGARARRRAHAALPEGVLRPPVGRADAAGDARAVRVDGGRARDVRRRASRASTSASSERTPTPRSRRQRWEREAWRPVLDDYRTAPIDEKLRAMLGLLETFTLRPDELGPRRTCARCSRRACRARRSATRSTSPSCSTRYDRLADTLGWELPETATTRRRGSSCSRRGTGSTARAGRPSHVEALRDRADDREREQRRDRR